MATRRANVVSHQLMHAIPTGLSILLLQPPGAVNCVTITGAAKTPCLLLVASEPRAQQMQGASMHVVGV